MDRVDATLVSTVHNLLYGYIHPTRAADTATMKSVGVMPNPQLSLHTPVGDLTISGDGDTVVAIDWGWGRDQNSSPMLCRVRDTLQAYFDGEVVVFDVAVRIVCGTPYQRRVWSLLQTVPPGSVITYGAVARMVGGSARSVGQALGSNPVPIIIPCHRVIGSTSLGGYSGGDGIATKRHLLELEAWAQRGGGSSLATSKHGMQN